MKKLESLFVLLVILFASQASARSLLRDRTISRYEKQDINKLLNTIGAQTITDAHQQIKGLQELLASLEAYDINQAQENLQSLFSFIKNLENALGVKDITQVTEQIEYLQSLDAHLANFDWKK